MAGRVLTPVLFRARRRAAAASGTVASTCEGDGQTVLVCGRGRDRQITPPLPGVPGHIRETPHTWTESYGEQFFENTPFHAISQMLEQWLVGQGASDAEERVSKLELALGSAGLRLNEAVPLIAEFLKIYGSGALPALLMAPKQKRRRLFAALSGWVFGAARFQPLVIVLEDAMGDPWAPRADPDAGRAGCDGALAVVVHGAAGVPGALVASASCPSHAQSAKREPSARDGWAGGAPSGTRVEDAGGGDHAPPVPLFIEELNRLVLESGGRIAPREIPSTLNGSLMARLRPTRAG